MRARALLILPAVVSGLLPVWTPALAQKLNLGVVAGTSLTGDFHAFSYTSSGGSDPAGTTYSYTFVSSPVSRSLIIGPKLELRLRSNFSLEVDALHRALRSRTTQFVSPPLVLPNGFSFSSFGPSTRTHASWEFPVLAKYHFSAGKLSPFVEAGASFRPAGTSSNVTHTGLTAGVGVQLHAAGVNISPTLRYTHWRGSSPGGGVLPDAIQNQVEFLVGFDRSTTSSSASAFGRKFSLGVLAGVGLGDDLRKPENSPAFVVQRADANSPIVGAMVEIDIHKNVSLEVDGIYRALHATVSSSEGRVRFAVLTWEFPVLAKYKFRLSGRVKPLVELGPSFRADGNPNGPPPSHYGVTGGIGVEARFGKLKISPAARYTRWAEGSAGNADWSGGPFLNQVQLLVGFSF